MIPSICTKMAVSMLNVWPIYVDLFLVRYFQLYVIIFLDSEVPTVETTCVV